MFFRVISKKTGSSIAPVYSYPLWYLAVLLDYNTKPLGTFLGRKMKEIEIVFIVVNYSRFHGQWPLLGKKAWIKLFDTARSISQFSHIYIFFSFKLHSFRMINSETCFSIWSCTKKKTIHNSLSLCLDVIFI